MIKYRIIKTKGGSFVPQRKILFFNWVNLSIYTITDFQGAVSVIEEYTTFRSYNDDYSIVWKSYKWRY